MVPVLMLFSKTGPSYDCWLNKDCDADVFDKSAIFLFLVLHVKFTETWRQYVTGEGNAEFLKWKKSMTKLRVTRGEYLSTLCGVTQDDLVLTFMPSDRRFEGRPYATGFEAVDARELISSAILCLSQKAAGSFVFHFDYVDFVALACQYEYPKKARSKVSEAIWRRPCKVRTSSDLQKKLKGLIIELEIKLCRIWNFEYDCSTVVTFLKLLLEFVVFPRKAMLNGITPLEKMEILFDALLEIARLGLQHALQVYADSLSCHAVDFANWVLYPDRMAIAIVFFAATSSYCENGPVLLDIPMQSIRDDLDELGVTEEDVTLSEVILQTLRELLSTCYVQTDEAKHKRRRTT